MANFLNRDGSHGYAVEKRKEEVYMKLKKILGMDSFQFPFKFT